MKLSTVFLLNAIVALLFGLGFLLIPEATLAPYGLTLDEVGINIARLYGAALLGYAVLTWSARNSEESAARSAIVLALFLSTGVGFVVSVVNQLSGLANALGWSTVVLFLLFTLAYGYFQFAQPSSTPKATPDPMDVTTS